MADPVDNRRRIGSLVRFGVVFDVDHAAARARLCDGDLETGWLPWLERRAGTTRDWDPPTIGEQALLLSENGDPATGVIIPGLFSDAHTAPADDPDLRRRVYPDGAIIEYDHQRHHLQATIPGSAAIECETTINATAGGDITAESGGSISATATENIALSAGGNITIAASGNVEITGADVGIN